MVKYWLLAIRPRTIPASVGPVLLGTALASQTSSIHWPLFLLAMACAVLLQIAVNLANDLFDGLAGIDTAERLGPARMVSSGFISASAMSAALALFTLAAMAAGLMLAAMTDWALLWFGLACIAAVFAYSAGPLPLASAGLGEVAVLVFFGWVAVMGSYWLQTGELTPTSFLYGSSAGLFSVAILLVNNLRDIPTDQHTGKHTLAVRLGADRTVQLYQASLILALLIHVLVSLPNLLLAIVPPLLLTKAVTRLSKDISHTRGRALNPMLGRTAQTGLMYCVVTSLLLIPWN
ncbi:1,4-dihydroxy-2-naphthoate polyprenyltransferase [Oceanobacter kriegii]|uniref:1,4-dihydroxy-2-naphthoate polyprenyltransferase n=1 Tax=Oceanobacter kriegii TaxID=64972 RepID=UPI0003FB6ABC|nr:1,4-dihydroxy-2-naphthoate polyprenyltransferase [Oceanobacter kriegii]